MSHLGSITVNNIMVSTGVVTATSQGATAVRLTGSKSVASTAGNEASGRVSIQQQDQGSTGVVKVDGWLSYAAGAEACYTAGNSAALEAGLGTQLNGFRLSWSAGTFANSGGVVRLYSRKIA